MNKYAVIVAGGSGTRMGTPVPKQFLLLNGKPVLWHTLTVFLNAYADLEIILVLPYEHLETGRALADSTGAPRRIRITAGGVTRFHSVQKGLELIRKDSLREIGERGEMIRSVIFVHDGVRCLLTTELVHRCYEGAVESGSAIPVTGSKDSVRLITDTGHEALDRSRVKLVQTPQTFLSSVILPAYAVDYEERFTDEATVVEASGHGVRLVEGELNNIKITTPADLIMAEQLLGGAIT